MDQVAAELGHADLGLRRVDPVDEDRCVGLAGHDVVRRPPEPRPVATGALHMPHFAGSVCARSRNRPDVRAAPVGL